MLRLFADLGFRWKIALPILLLAGLLVLIGSLGVQGIGQVADSSTRLTNRYLPAISLLLNADRDLYQAFVAERSLLDEAAGEFAQSLRDSHAENLQQAYERVHKYADMQPGAEAKALVAKFDAGFAQWKSTSGKVLALTESDPAAASALSYGDSEAQFEAMRDAIDKLGELEDNEANAEGKAAMDLGEERSWQQGLIIAIGLLICCVLVVGFPVLVTRPLHNLLNRIEQIAEGDGDLRVRLEVLSRDELGKLSDAFNRFLDKLQPLIREVGRVTGEVAESAQTLAGMAAANDRLITSEHAAVDQVSTAATEMSAAVHEVARNAQNAADAARSAEVQSREGAEVVGATIHAIRQLAHEVESASDTIQTLEQETANIGAVLAVIKGIAEQTNLLALNAAIEAARAGEQGRGFAVVADEVRALAARTQDSTKDIQQMIERLQGGVQNAVKAMHVGSEKARFSVERAAGVDGALSATGDAVARINDMAAQIATACEEQSSVTEEIARNISDIRDLSNEAAQTSEQSTQASARLSELSHGLAQLVGRFRV
ncbi:methyl-accepting chemotaxis protein [Aquipseudomonas alcaligenes]|uniref:Chemotaxis transducer n=2 Tax=Aquipseudomonas alcaligenes TaxID=43263 RepID=A0AA37CGH7_AQUAC|nr:methyl-accepting chemotaxis protein [Pseudomonas alcaligenes]BCR24789.1 chemotaxis transducer [Pseudomonas alcaligenes]GIZ66096.1 chemotaxis transducer [Pseudomonas alcaligenes]GIZ70311.1 chemotaxis transducer [Pseudomonas alcaligenes]GIZ74664.1 chemotaxis transducer [Pseudomonas alcaligenes]GIZ79110.1 chemotaxis transducer [Pseudomonas alcaligenes]